MECGIDEMKYPDKKFVGSYMFNSYRKHEILLLPIEILHKLPIAKSWEEIDSVVTENNIIRSVMNQQVAEEWSKYSASLKKQYLREKVFTDSNTCQYVVDEYKKEELDLYITQKIELSTCQKRFGRELQNWICHGRQNSRLRLLIVRWQHQK